MNFFKTKILGTGSYLPRRILTNHELAPEINSSHEWIKTRTGIEERRIADLDQNEAPSDMGARASLRALEAAHLRPNDVDLILVSTTLADQVMPNTAAEIQSKLGITNLCPALDVNAACSGWIYLLSMADALIKTGTYQHILIIATEMTSAFNNWNDRKTCILFGDGAGAALLGRTPDLSATTNKKNKQENLPQKNHESSILSSVLLCDSSKKDHLTLLAGGAKKRITHEVLTKDEQWMTMNGQEIYKAAVKTMGLLTHQVLQTAQLKIEDVDWFIPHQANIRIIEAIKNRFSIPAEKILINVNRYANTSSASVPIALDEGIKKGKVQRGDLLLLPTFGAGLTSGAVLLRY